MTVPKNFTKAIFAQNFDLVQDFIWSFLYESGRQYFPPYSDIKTKKIIIIHEI